MRPVICLTLGLTVATQLGCGKPQAPEADVSKAGVTSPAEAQARNQRSPTFPIDTGLKPDSAYPVPDLAPEELLRFINQLAQPQRGSTAEEITADEVSRARSRLVAADRIILTRGIDPALTEAGVKAKLDPLRIRAVLEPNSLGVNFQPFVEALNQGNSPRLTLLGRVSQFDYEIDRLSFGEKQTADKVVDRLKDILSDDGQATPSS